jgi:hypothetical protein
VEGYKSLADLVREELGVPTFLSTNRVTATVGVAAEQVFRQTPARVWLFIVNLSLNTVYVGPFNNPSATRGIQLNPSGGFMQLDYREDMDLVGYEWFGVATGAASAVLCLELLTQNEPVG